MNQESLNQEELARQRNQEKEKQVFDEIKNLNLEGAIQDKDNSQITMLSYFIVIMAIIGDLFGLIPIAGNFLGLCFGVILTMLYFFNGIGKGRTSRMKKKLIRRWVFRLALYLIEVLALGFSWLPLFTIEALIDFYLSKKGLYTAMEKVKETIDKIKEI